MNGAIGLEIWVDGHPYGRLRATGRLSIPIGPGNHHVEAITSQGKSGVGTISTASGEKTVTVALSVMGTPKFS